MTLAVAFRGVACRRGGFASIAAIALEPPREFELVACSADALGPKNGDVHIDGISGVVGRDRHLIWIGLYAPGFRLFGKFHEEFGMDGLAVEWIALEASESGPVKRQARDVRDAGRSALSF